MQINCIGIDVRTDPFFIEFVARDFPNVEASHRLIRGAADLYRGKCLPDSDIDWTTEAQRHRDALIAIDVRNRGGKYRDIAVAIHGEKRVAEDWNAPDRTLKNRVIRSFKRGLRMVQDGYRGLLK